MTSTEAAPAPPGRTSLFGFVTVTRVAIALGLILALIEVRQNPVLLDPVSVPEDLRTKGLTADAVANKLLDELVAISDDARTIWQRRLVSGSWSSVDIVVPVAGFSFQSIVRFVRHTLRIPTLRVTGEIVQAPEGTWILTIRMSNGRRVFREPLVSIDHLDATLRKAAESVWYDLDPFTLAAYYWPRDADRTLEIVRHCLSTPPTTDDPWAFNLWGNLHLQAGESAAAIVRFQQATELARSWWVPHHNWGLALMQSNDAQSAVGHFRSAVMLDGQRSAKLLTDFGIARRMSGDLNGAREVLERAASLDRAYAPGFTELVRTYVASSNAVRGQRTCARGASMFPDNGVAQEACGDAAVLAGDAKLASHYYARAAALMPMTTRFCLKWAAVLERAGDPTGAAAQYRNVLIDDPANEVALASLRRLDGGKMQ